MFQQLQYVLNTSWIEKQADWREYHANRELCGILETSLAWHRGKISSQLYGCIYSDSGRYCANFKHDTPCPRPQSNCAMHACQHRYVEVYNDYHKQQELVKHFWARRAKLRAQYVASVDANTRKQDMQEYTELTRELTNAKRALQQHSPEHPNNLHTSDTEYAIMAKKLAELREKIAFFWGRRMSQRVK